MGDEPNRADHLKVHQFKAGKSGNPGGRPEGLEKRTRSIVGNDIDGIVYVQRCIALGVPPDPNELRELGIKLTAAQVEAMGKTFAQISRRDVNEAAKLVCDRGWGKAKQHVDITGRSRGVVPKNMPAMTKEQLQALAALDDGTQGIDDDDLAAMDTGPDRGATEH